MHIKQRHQAKPSGEDHFQPPSPSCKVTHHETGDPMSQAVDYSRYQTLRITKRGFNDSVLDIQMKADGPGGNGKLPTAGHEGHWELAEIWRDVSRDDTVRAAVLRGEGLGFSGGGDLTLVEDMAKDFDVRSRVWKEARDLVYNVINCDKPIVSAMHGPAVGAGLVAGLLADISIASKTAKIVDGHTRLGVALSLIHI
jgi:enoyl-CoA hydratase